MLYIHEEGVKSANRLTNSHIRFQNVKMKVRYAVQVLSRRVAKSLEFCRETLKLEEFKNSKATQEFVQIMNDIFDLFNSHCKYSPTFNSTKDALREENKSVWMSTLQNTQEYVMGLKNIHGQSLVKEDSRKTGFIGIISNIHCIRLIYDTNVQNGPLEYLCTFKLSQDPLEQFFGLVRLRCGLNNNPTPMQFKAIYKKILIGVSTKIVENSNVTLLDYDNLVAVTPNTQDRIEHLFDLYNCEDFDIEDFSM